ncbi:NAD(P)-dependent oxidoreductase [Propionibacteriaceae bacterium Y1685]
MKRVLVTSRSFDGGSGGLTARLAEAGLEVVRSGPGHELSDLRELDQVVAWIAGTGPITAEHLDLFAELRVIARYGVGHESVDHSAAAAREVVITNTPGANSDAVADHTLALMLAALRQVHIGDRRVRAGDWNALRGRELGSLHVGLIGFGRIGQLVAARLKGFGSRISAYDPVPPSMPGVDAVADLSELSGCDLVSVHAPGGPVVITPAFLDRVTPGFTLINTARPELIDETALAAALRSGQVATFAADTLTGDAAGGASPLLAEDLADRVLLTPHSGAQTLEAIDRMGAMAVANVLAVLAGAEPPHPVRTPVLSHS